MLDGFTIVYRSSVDLFFYVMGSANENGVSVTLNSLFLLELTGVSAHLGKRLELPSRLNQSDFAKECGKAQPLRQPGHRFTSAG